MITKANSLVLLLTATLAYTEASLRGTNTLINDDSVTIKQQQQYRDLVETPDNKTSNRVNKHHSDINVHNINHHHPQNEHLHKHSKPETANFGTRIVGGNKAMPGEYPFFVGWGGCGASLIHDDIVLSAAHCDVSWASNFVVVGAYEDGVQGNGAVQRKITNKVLHPNYFTDEAGTELYDFMIIKLDKPVKNKPVQLNRNTNRPVNNKDLTVVGFGATSEGGAGARFLQEVVVKTIPHNTCAQQNSQFDIRRDIHLCGGVNGGGKDSCQGDSGGPIFEYHNGVPVQVGVVSFGEGCARPQYPGVYARVSGVIDWIDEQICALSTYNRPARCGSFPNSPAPVPVPVPVPTPVPTPSPVDDELGSGPTPTYGGSGPTPTFEGSGPTPTVSGLFPSPTGDEFRSPSW